MVATLLRMLSGPMAALALAAGLAVSAAQAATAVEESQAWLEDAREHLAGGDPAAAVIDLKNALQQDPKNAEARLLLGRVYLDLGRPLEAEKELNEARSLGIAKERWMAPLGRAMLLQRRFKELLEQFDATDQPPDLAFDILLLRAQAQAGQRQSDLALETLEKAARLRPEDGRAYVVQARLLGALGRTEAAAKTIEAALATSPDLIEAHLLSADLRRQRGDAEGSLADYGRALELQPDSAAALLGRAASLLMLSRDEEAKADVQVVLDEAPENPMARYLDAHLKLRAGDIDGAAQVLSEIGNALDRFSPAHWLNGIVDYAQGKYETARVWLERYLAAAPANIEARKLLGATLIRLNAAEDAVDVLKPVREQAPEDVQGMALLGSAYLRAGRHAEAVEELEAAAKLVPENPGLLSGLALGQLATGDTAQAQASFDSALDLGLEDTAVGHLIAMSLLNAGRHEEALEMARELQARFPDSPLPRNLEGAAHVGVGDWEKARAAITAALEIDPSLLSARLNLAAIEARQGNLDHAETSYLRILEDEEDSVVAMTGLAGIAQRQGKLQDALAWRQRAHEVDKTAVAPGLAYVETLIASGETGEAMAVIQQMRTGDADRPELLNALGSLQAAQGEHGEAIATFSRLVEVSDGAPAVRLRLAQAHQAAGDSARARTELKALVNAAPAYGPASVALARTVLQEDGAEAALALAERFVEANPDQPWSQQLAGDLLLQAGRTEEAVAAYETAWAQAQNSSLAIALYRARSLAGAGEAALAPLEERLAAEPGDLEVRTALASAQIGLGRNEAARESYEVLVEAGSTNATVWNNLAWLYFEAGDGRALEYAERALLLAPNQPAIMDTLAWIQLQQGEPAQALRLLEQANAGAPDHPEIGYHYAVALHRNGRDADAEVVLRRVLENGQDFPSAADAKALLAKITGN